MAHLNAKKTLTAVALAAATIATPAFAHANNYATTSYNSYHDDCRSNIDEQVLAGAVGAVLGGVLGSQVSGNGARTEGSVLGAVLGGAAGAAIADGNNDCDKIRKRSVSNTQSRVYDQGYTNTGYSSGRRVSSRTVYTAPRVTTVSTGGYSDRGYGYNNRGGYDPIDRINRRMDHLRKERAALKREQSYYGHSRRIDRRLYDIKCELADLKDRKKYVKKVERRRKDRNYY